MLLCKNQCYCTKTELRLDRQRMAQKPKKTNRTAKPGTTTMVTTTTTIPKDEDDLNEEFFTTILQKRYGSVNGNDGPNIVVSSVKIHREHSGVLSQVYRVTLHFDDSTDSPRPPSHWIVKLVRNDLNLRWMCQNETRFYSLYAPKMTTTTTTTTTRLIGTTSNDEKSSSPPIPTLPFQIPKYLDGSSDFLILEQILNVDTFALVDGCPKDKLDTMLECLASLHATWWNDPFLLQSSASEFDSKTSSENSNDDGDSNNNDDNNNSNATNSCKESLVFPVGMGQRLPSLQKEGLFVRSWKETLDNMSFGESSHDCGADDNDPCHSNSSSSDTTKSFIYKMCQQLENLRLRDVHGLVHKHRITLVHGDFHVANFLWPSLESSTATANGGDTNAAESKSRPYLLDFATCGCGNPLVDFVFFFVVSTNNDCVSNIYGWLRKYYDLLIKHNPNIRSTLTVEALKEMMMPVLLCQWLILVSYDSMCRQIALSEINEGKRKMTIMHFNNVNQRTVLAMKGLDGWDKLLNQIPKTNDKERLEAQEFCDNTPLEI